MNDNMVSDTTSPIDAANGVAILSGFQLHLWDVSITATSTKSEVVERFFLYRFLRSNCMHRIFL